MSPSAHRQNILLASKVMTTGTFVPSGSVSDFWSSRASVMFSSSTPDKTDVRTNAPDTKTLAVTVNLQLAFTVHVPVSDSIAKSPPTLRASVPDKVTSARTLSLPTAANGTGPVERSSIKVTVNPYAPAA